MVRKFLYAFALLIALVIATAIAFRLDPSLFMRGAFVPSARFEAQPQLAKGRYAAADMWYARGGQIVDNPALWTPDSLKTGQRGNAAIFFVHPTSYVAKSHWNAPLDDPEADARARIFLRGDASVFNAAGEIWAPRYRQATIGAFLTDRADSRAAIDLAYRDVEQAFAAFIAEVPADRPLILAGHSQGSLHLLRLLKDHVAGTPLAKRIVAAYVVGWPVSLEHDISALGLPICARADQAGCIMTYSSFAEPAEPAMVLESYARSIGFDGTARGGSRIACVNPLTGSADADAPASANPGTLIPNAAFTSGTLVAGAVSARCGDYGLLLIGDPPKMGNYVLPGNNYHVYDYALFWLALRQDVARRLKAFAP